MKKFKTLFSICALAGSFANAQTITTNCTDVNASGPYPPFPSNLIESAAVSGTGCSKHVVGPYTPADAKLWLERKDWSSGGWTNLTGATGVSAGFSLSFSGLTHGTYRVRCEVPTMYTSASCPSGIAYFDLSDQFVGYQAVLDPADYYSNEGIVGQTDATDIAAGFYSGGSSPNSYDNGDDPVLDTHGTINYDQFWIAIFENGSPNRYASWWSSWQNGAVPSDQISMTYIFSGTNGWAWNFVDYNSYTAQFAIQNTACPSTPTWTHLDKDFFICPPGTGCKYGYNNVERLPIRIHNTNDYLTFYNLDNDMSKYELVITGMDGRMDKKITGLLSPTIDINELPAGMYIASMSKNGKNEFTGKFVKQ